MSNPIEDAARAFLTNTPKVASDERTERDEREIDLFFERALKFQQFMRSPHDAPETEARIATMMIRMMLPGWDESAHDAVCREICDSFGVEPPPGAKQEVVDP